MPLLREALCGSNSALLKVEQCGSNYALLKVVWPGELIFLQVWTVVLPYLHKKRQRDTCIFSSASF